jgi:hypothetical protein
LKNRAKRNVAGWKWRNLTPCWAPVTLICNRLVLLRKAKSKFQELNPNFINERRGVGFKSWTP